MFVEPVFLLLINVKSFLSILFIFIAIHFYTDSKALTSCMVLSTAVTEVEDPAIKTIALGMIALLYSISLRARAGATTNE